MSLNILRGCAAHSALLLSGGNSYFCTPLTTVAGEATDLIAANHTSHTQAAASDDRYLSYVSVLSKPYKSTVTQLPSAPASQRSASFNKMCVFVCSPRVLRIMLVGNVARIGVKRTVFIVLVEKPVGKGLLRRPWRRMVDNIEIDLEEIRGAWIGLNWLRMGTSGRLL